MQISAKKTLTTAIVSVALLLAGAATGHLTSDRAGEGPWYKVDQSVQAGEGPWYKAGQSVQAGEGPWYGTASGSKHGQNGEGPWYKA